MQTALTYRTNRDLFSNYYLDEHLPETEEWDEVSDEELQEAYDDVMDLWEREKDTAPKRNESQLEEKFIRPMFRKLGIPFEVEESTDRTQRRPDYGFFETEEAARDAFERRDEGGDFYKNSVAVADAKRWGRPSTLAEAVNTNVTSRTPVTRSTSTCRKWMLHSGLS